MIDLSKLTPAPWTVGVTDAELIIRCHGEECDVATIIWEDRDQHWQPQDAAFIAMARNAFDVMMRRGWNAIQQPDETWGVFWPDYQSGDLVVDAGKGFRFFANPFTALIEADKWYAANVEGLTPSQGAGKISDAK